MLLGEIPIRILRQVKKLELRDVTIAFNPQIVYFNSLRQLDLGYVTVVNAELCEVLVANANTLEELHLSWIVESSQQHLFGVVPHIQGRGKVAPLPKLKSFRSKGPHMFNPSGLLVLFSEVDSFEDLHLESLSPASAIVWAHVMNQMTADEAPTIRGLQGVRFGAPISSTAFWDAAAQLISKSGGELRSIAINGSPKGAKTPIPQSLQNYITGGMPSQPNLERLVIIWRDGTGVGEETLKSLHATADTLEFLHLMISFPTLDSVNRVLDLVAPFERLRQLHLVFPFHDDDAPAHIHLLQKQLQRDIRGKTGMCSELSERIVGILPSLEYLSWTIYEYFRPEAQPSYFAKVFYSMPASSP